jgi:hypothetical protein
MIAGHPQMLFGHFSAAMFTMFQVCTGDSWASTIVRPMWMDTGGSNGHPQWISAVFFVSYMMIASIILINIVRQLSHSPPPLSPHMGF